MNISAFSVRLHSPKFIEEVNLGMNAISTLRGWLIQNPVLAAGIWVQLGLAILALLAMPFDSRQILGINPWIKPLKFDFSVLILLITTAAFLSGLTRFDTARWWIGSSIAVALTLENCVISIQAFRGVRSHMNYTTPLDARLFMSMGLMAIVATLAVAFTLALMFIDRPTWPIAVTWGVRLGLLMFLCGSVEGVLMIVRSGHTVGANDGLTGLPFLNWSRRYGDLRVAHFFALHAVQAFPLLGLLLSRTSLDQRTQVTMVFTGAAVYTIVVWLLFRQALAGQPLIA
jgi:hypothetical protein